MPITLQRKLKNDLKYDFIEEKARFVRNEINNTWSFLSSDLNIQKANSKMVKATQEKQFKK